jgi:hypothetical protein
MSGPYYTPPRLARLWAMDPATVRSLLESGQLRGFNVARRNSRRPRWRISPEAMQEFEQSRAAIPKVETKRRPRRQTKGKEWF